MGAKFLFGHTVVQVQVQLNPLIFSNKGTLMSFQLDFALTKKDAKPNLPTIFLTNNLKNPNLGTIHIIFAL